VNLNSDLPGQQNQLEPGPFLRGKKTGGEKGGSWVSRSSSDVNRSKGEKILGLLRDDLYWSTSRINFELPNHSEVESFAGVSQKRQQSPISPRTLFLLAFIMVSVLTLRT
jgi:hypothetical protein